VAALGAGGRESAGEAGPRVGWVGGAGRARGDFVAGFVPCRARHQRRAG
jgi:hypothetical protein